MNNILGDPCCVTEMPLAKVECESIQSGLARKQARLTQQLEDVTAALDALNANPEVARVFEMVTKAGRY